MTPTPFPHELLGLRPRWHDPRQKALHMAFTMTTQLLAGPRTPFGAVSRSGVLLCDETRDALRARDWGAKREPYRRGSRPRLERFVTRIVGENPVPNFQTVAALSQSLSSLPAIYGTPPAFLYGESDEETLLKGGGHCSCKARLLVALCQTLGIDARPVMSWARPHPGTRDLVAGHTVVEAWLDGAWRFFDPQRRLYAFAHGRGWSIEQIHADPVGLTGTPADLLDEMQPNLSAGPMGSGLEAYARAMFGPEAMISVGRYDLDDPAIEPRWTWADEAFRVKQRRDFDNLLVTTNRLADRGELTDEVYRLGVRPFRARFGLTGELPSQETDEENLGF